MREKYVLNTSIFYYSENGEGTLLSNSEIKSYDYDELKRMFDNLPGEIYIGEYIPNIECIKCSAIITSLDDDRFFELMLEKYYIYNFKDFIKYCFDILFFLSRYHYYA